MEGYYNLSELKEKGWTDKMVRELLPDPELRRNPFYANAAPIKLWKIQDVEAVMGTDAYAAASEKAAKRRAAAKKAAVTREERTVEQSRKIADMIHVRTRPAEKVMKAAYQKKREQGLNNCYHLDPMSSIPEDVLHRWAVNYIRHSLTRYDRELDLIKGRTGKQAAYDIIKRETLLKIAEAYPEFADECRRQAGEVLASD